MWLLFGVRISHLHNRLTKMYLRWRYGSIKLCVPTYRNLDAMTKATCHSFVANHMSRAREQLYEKRR